MKKTLISILFSINALLLQSNLSYGAQIIPKPIANIGVTQSQEIYPEIYNHFNVKEIQKLKLPTYFHESSFREIVKNSFEDNSEIYLVISELNKPFCIENVCIINSKTNLEELISKSKPIKKQKKQQDRKKIEKTYYVNYFLENIPKKKAEEIIIYANTYYQNLGIKFIPTQNEQISENLNIIFSQESLETTIDTKSKKKIIGKAPNQNLTHAQYLPPNTIWVNANHENPYELLIHEIAHFLDLNHDYINNSLMHPFYSFEKPILSKKNIKDLKQRLK